jgi:glycolate oxidase FAD binding subunit
MSAFSPGTVRELGEVISWAAAEEQPIEIVGGGSKRGIGRKAQVQHVLDLRRLSGIGAYEPAELVITAAAATPLAEIEAALSASGQMLAFEPVDWRALVDSEASAQTIGGVVACNLSGPRRIKSGAARDHFLGFHAVNGRGEVFKSGGKVVKNVTGYDLCKLMAGAYGTLGVLTELTLKVLPRPEVTRTVLLLGLSDVDAVSALANALNSPHEVSGAAHVPARLVRQSAVAEIAGAGGPVTALRVEGPEPSVIHRCLELRESFGGAGELDPEASGRFWREIGNVSLLTEPRERAIWRISVAPSSGPAIGEVLARQLDADCFYDWGGGLVWVAVGTVQKDCGAAVVRAAVANAVGNWGGGHATLIRGAESVRAVVDVFEPLAPPLAALSARVKESFDPRRILNPGRMYAGI